MVKTADALLNKTLEEPTINETTINEAVSISTENQLPKIFDNDNKFSARNKGNGEQACTKLDCGTKYIFDYDKVTSTTDTPFLYLMKSLPFEYGGNDNFSDNEISTNDSRVSITKRYK